MCKYFLLLAYCSSYEHLYKDILFVCLLCFVVVVLCVFCFGEGLNFAFCLLLCSFCEHLYKGRLFFFVEFCLLLIQRKVVVFLCWILPSACFFGRSEKHLYKERLFVFLCLLNFAVCLLLWAFCEHLHKGWDFCLAGCLVGFYSQFELLWAQPSLWYNRTGWLGVKHQVTWRGPHPAITVLIDWA